MEHKIARFLLLGTLLNSSNAEINFLDYYYNADVVCRGENYIPDVTDCRRYYDCTTGTPIPLICPLALHWNSVIDECDFPSAVPECIGGTRPPLPTGGTFPTHGSTTSTTTTEGGTGSTSTEDPPIDCGTVEQGYIPHHDCTKFYICDDYIGTVFRCPLGLYWNPQYNVCDYPTSVPECQGGTRPPIFSSVTKPVYINI